ncbi:helix-turn-helix domain-containing protein [Ornithinimicrobium faecis]|uniref:helix-turn-helix domain-containing protein n=1 Tax=Ornithinimicrobium faecis TaxID=2934158 RepID=UPI002118A80B|nr:helix-turn-helix transcriptional regulator [Ornithinimicrobium sp. HY1745]
MGLAEEDLNRRMLRARDVMDRSYAEALDIPSLASVALVSESHFIRSFRAVFGETPHRYLQRRRVERAMFLLRTGDRPVTEICFEVGFSSLGTFSRTFSAIVGTSPSAYRRRGPLPHVPSCFAMRWARPSGHLPATEARQASPSTPSASSTPRAPSTPSAASTREIAGSGPLLRLRSHDDDFDIELDATHPTSGPAGTG